MKLSNRIFLATLLGGLTAYMLPEWGEYFKRGADLFTQLVNMIVVLLVVSTVALGIINLKTPKSIGKVAGWSFYYFMFLTTTALFLGMGLAYLTGLGSNLHLELPVNTLTLELPSIGDMILSWIPTNPLESLAKGNIIQIIVFASFLGLAINVSGERGKPVIEILESLSDTMQQITGIIVSLTPFGVYCIVAYAFSTLQVSNWESIPLQFLLAYLAGAIILMGVIYSSLLGLWWGLNPLHFFRGMLDAMIVAFATRSSTATLPVTLHCMTQNLGIHQKIASFVAPMGSSLNLNGMALFHGMSVIFIAQAYGIQLGLSQIGVIVVVALLTAVGTGGIPGAGLLQLYAIFKTVGLPIEGIALIAIFDTLRDMVSSMLNVLGDAVSAIGVARHKDAFDSRVYRHIYYYEWESSEI